MIDEWKDLRQIVRNSGVSPDDTDDLLLLFSNVYTEQIQHATFDSRGEYQRFFNENVLKDDRVIDAFDAYDVPPVELIESSAGRFRVKPAEGTVPNVDDSTTRAILGEVKKYFADRPDGTEFVGRPDDQFIEDSFFDFAYLSGFDEIERYWVNKPYTYVSILRKPEQSDRLYYINEPVLDEIEAYVYDTLMEHLQQSAIDDIPVKKTRVREVIKDHSPPLDDGSLWKLSYYIHRDFAAYGRIDAPMRDPAVRTVTCSGVNVPIFVRHTDFENIETNVSFDEDRLNSFLERLGAYSHTDLPVTDSIARMDLPDGSSVQVTRGDDISPRGTNFSIKKPPYKLTPIDLINGNTFSLDQMAFLWLCIENRRSILFTGGTGAGKTTTLNAVALFIPTKAKIVTIEDANHMDLPQQNWIAAVTQPERSGGDRDEVNKIDLLKTALRQRPDYIVVDEIQGEEARTLFEAMSTGHTTYTTFHADSVGEVLKRFTTDPINVSKSMFTALDLVSIQTQTRAQGKKVRRNRSLTEINHYDAENDEITVQDIYQWQPETDQYLKMGESNVLEKIKFDQGWTEDRVDSEIFKRKTVLAYLICEGISDYGSVATIIQSFINDPDTVVKLMSNEQLEDALDELQEVGSIDVQVDPKDEKTVPGPEPDDAIVAEASTILEEAEERLFDAVRERDEQEGSEVTESLDKPAVGESEEEFEESQTNYGKE